jgi:hypothetical protein
MNILKIVVALICAYGLFVSISYLLMRLLFPKVEINEENGKVRVVNAKHIEKRLARTSIGRSVKRQKNLAY